MGSADVDFERLFVSDFRSVMRTVFLICHDNDRAQDLTQDAFVQALLHWDRVCRLERPGAWVRRIAIRLAVRSVRREAARRDLERASDTPHPPGPWERDADLFAAVRGLSAKQRAAVVLYYFEDLDTHEIADLMGCSVATARVHLHRGRERLRSMLGSEVYGDAD
jgi:RNA polymerase sigma factor (sigma-70 family)